MKLQSKVVVLLVCTFAVFGLAVHAIQRSVVLPSFFELEREEAVKDIERCRRALAREIEHLANQCKDWSDTYKFILDGNAEYLEATLFLDSFDTARLNLIYYFDSEGELKWGKTRDLETMEDIPTESTSIEQVIRQHRLYEHKNRDSVKHGLIMTREGPLLIASRPVVLSSKEGPIRGAMIMGRFLTDQKITQLAEQTRVDLSIWPIGAGAVPREAQKALAAVRDSRTPYIEVRGEVLEALTVFRDIDGKPALLMRARIPRAIAARGFEAMRFATATVIVAGFTALTLLLVLLQRVVIGPIGRLTEHAVNIGVSGSLTSQLKLNRNDEIGLLAREFDRMVHNLAESRKKLIEASHNAGKAEIASGVLHNVGNALNSMNVSADRALGKVRKLEVQDVAAVANLLLQNEHDLASFVSTDEKGKLVPAFLSELSKHLVDEQNAVLDELKVLSTSVDHITEIVNTQQEYARASGVMDTVEPVELVEDAIRINSAAMGRHGVTVIRDFEDVPPLTTDRHAVLQILINLLNNAKYALDNGKPDQKNLIVRMRTDEENDKGFLRIDVVDNGVGIPKESLTRVFAHGFTTRAEGHGFGLHSGALSAKNLGGSLTAKSDGLGHGATFTLKLPTVPVKERQ